MFAELLASLLSVCNNAYISTTEGTTMSTYKGRTIETTASTFTAQTVTAEVTGYQHSASRSGRLGIEVIVPTRDEALAVAKALRSSGHRARVV